MQVLNAAFQRFGGRLLDPLTGLPVAVGECHYMLQLDPSKLNDAVLRVYGQCAHNIDLKQVQAVVVVDVLDA